MKKKLISISITSLLLSLAMWVVTYINQSDHISAPHEAPEMEAVYERLIQNTAESNIEKTSVTEHTNSK